MLKKLIVLSALLCFSVGILTISGCAKKEAEPEKEVTEAPADTTEAAEDTTVVE